MHHNNYITEPSGFKNVLGNAPKCLKFKVTCIEDKQRIVLFP